MLATVTTANASAVMAQTFGAHNASGSASVSASPSAATTAGDLLVATIRDRNATAVAPVSNVTDAAGNVWSRAASVTQGQAVEDVWYVANARSLSTSQAVTVTVGGTSAATSAIAFTVLDVTGTTAAPLDVTATNSGNTQPASTGTATTTQASEIAIGDIGWNASVTVSGQSAGYTSTAIQQSTVSGSAAGEQAAWRLLSATGAQTYGATLSSSSVVWTGAIATFKVGASGTPPAITSFTPTSGTDGTSVTITGSGFTNGTSAVTFNGKTAGYTVTSDTQIAATVPAGATTGPIAVTTSGGTATSSSSFTVDAVITSFSPTSGPVGTAVTITGSGFTGATAVTFNGTNQPTFTVTSDSQITTSVPSGATTGTIKVTTPANTATSPTSFTVSTASAPTISSFTPTSGPVGTTVTITGSGFTGATAVTFNGTNQPTFTVNSDTQVTANVPSGATTGTIAVTTSAGTATSPGSFTVTSAKPHIMVIVEENKAYDKSVGSPYIIGNSSAPYINSLATQHRSATNWYAVEHNSPYDYYDLVSGADQSSSSKPYTAPTLGNQLTGAGIPWIAYMEGMPSACYAGTSINYYSVIHNPFQPFQSYSTQCANVVPYPCPTASGCETSSAGATNMVSTLDGPTAPDFVWITPNICDDMHTSTSPCPSNGVATGDTWLKNNLPAVLASSWYMAGGIIIITVDESIGVDTSSCTGCGDSGGHIATVIVSQNNAGLGSFTSPGDHFGVLRSIEESYGLPLLGGAANLAHGDLISGF